MKPSVIILTLVCTTLSTVCTSCSSKHDSQYIEADDSDIVYLYDWNEGRENIGDNDDASRTEHRVTKSNGIINEDIHMDGYCVNIDDEYDDEEMNFYDNETYYPNNGELSDEEMDEIDELYEE